MNVLHRPTLFDTIYNEKVKFRRLLKEQNANTCIIKRDSQKKENTSTNKAAYTEVNTVNHA